MLYLPAVLLAPVVSKFPPWLALYGDVVPCFITSSLNGVNVHLVLPEYVAVANLPVYVI